MTEIHLFQLSKIDESPSLNVRDAIVMQMQFSQFDDRLIDEHMDGLHFIMWEIQFFQLRKSCKNKQNE